MSPALEEAIQRTVARARESARTQFLAQVVALPELRPGDGIRCMDWAGTRDRWYWERVDRGELHFAWGSVDELESEGPDRYATVRAWQRDLGARLAFVGAPRPSERPVCVGGFAFEGRASAEPDWKSFPAARFVLPEGIVESVGGAAQGIVFARVEPNAVSPSIRALLARRLEDLQRALQGRIEPREPSPDPERPDEGPEFRVRADRSHERFRAQVRDALAEIEAGRLLKVVLARSLTVENDAEFDVAGFLGRLRAIYPSCTLVAVGRGRDTFLAATPETLVRVEGRRVETAALAGSAPRGRTPEEDRALGESLLESAKNRAEHAHVVDAIRAVLGPRTEALSLPAAPHLKALFGIQHLETPIEGLLAARRGGQEATDVLELVELLHPTPAVSGAPARAAADWIGRFEGLVRGWYAAPIGWLDGSGGGAFCVALRSALIRNGGALTGGSGASRARLFAGAGIVAGSDPEQELVETRIKLRALLAPLTEI